jgi:two-component system response regulator YesN
VEEGARKDRSIRISALLAGLIDKDQTDELAKDLGIDTYHNFRAVALKLSEGSRVTADIISDLLSKDHTLFKQDETEPAEFIICISGANTPEQLIGRVNDRIKIILKGTNGRVSYAGTGQTEDNVQSLPLSRKQASSAMRFAEFWDIGTLLPFEYTVEKTVEFDGRIGEFLTKCNYYTKQLLHGVRSSDHDNVMSIIIEMFEYYKSVEGAGYDLIRNHIFNTFSETLLELYSLNSSIDPVNLEDLTQWNRVLDMKRLKDIKMLTFRFYENAMCFMGKKGNRDESIIKKALELIREKPAAEVSLKTLAGELLLSPNYLGTIFRKTVGKPFNEYLNEYRMEKAKELLSSTENNVAWVSREVGLFNTSYFCSLFKEAFGITPGEYHDLATRK